MGIRFYCPDCGRRLNIKAFLAGKRGICPHCDVRVQIPLESQIPASAPRHRPVTAGGEVATPVVTAVGRDTGDAVGGSPSPSLVATSTDPIGDSPDSVWYVRPSSGGQYGPARGDVMRKWLAEGRVSADSMVWREGWTDWKIAGPVFPSLQPTGAGTRPKSEPAASFLVHDNNLEERDIGNSDVARRANRKKSIAPLVILGSLIAVLLGVVVVVLTRG